MIHRISTSMLATALLALSAQASSDDTMLPVWQIDGDNNRVYLLGSVHLLREQDYPLPAGIYDAYDDAESLVMELDMDDLDLGQMQSLVAELGSIADGGSLAAMMGPQYAEAETLAAPLEVPLELLSAMEPWLAAITVEQLVLQRIGFDPAFGIESHLVARAGTDGKEIVGLEELAEQLAFLDSLSLDAQRALLIQTLEEATDIEPMMDGLIDAWRRGDVGYLEDNMLADMMDYPELYDAVVVRRNRNWVERIDTLLDADEDYLVIVGALHLVGKDSLPAMLGERGHIARQLEQ